MFYILFLIKKNCDSLIPSFLMSNVSQNITFLYVLYSFFIIKKSDSLIPSFLMSDVSESLRLLTKNERCEQIAQAAHQS